MVPKKIHYCWLATWQQVMPDYEIVCWDKTKFDIDSHPFVAEACRVKKWAFAADYIRLHALYTEGGIYLDSDVIVKKPFDDFLKYEFFTAVEYHKEIVAKENATQYLNADGSSRKPWTAIPGIGIQAAILGGVPGNPYLKDCLDYYRDRHFILENGEYHNQIIAPAIFAMVAEAYGFRYRDERQELKNNLLILPSKVFTGRWDGITEETHAIHFCFSSWREARREKYIKKIKNFGRRFLLGKA